MISSQQRQIVGHLEENLINLKAFRIILYQRDIPKHFSSQTLSVESNQILSTQAPSISFPKADRFKELKPEDYNGNALLQIYECRLDNLADFTKDTKGVIFPKQPRFKEPEIPEYELEINPNWDFIKPKPSGVVIKPETKKLDLTQDSLDFADDTTQASIGPQSYSIISDWGVARGGKFPRASRFKKEEKIEQLILYPNIDAVKPKAKVTVVMKKNIESNKNQQILQEENEKDEKNRIQLYKNRKLDLYDHLKKQQAAPVYKPSILEQMPKRVQILIKLKQMYNDLIGPGAYDELQPKAEPCMVKFRRNSHSPRIRNDQQTPGPDYYYSKDDLIKPDHQGYTFAQETRFNFDEEIDLQEPLNIKLTLIKPRIKMGFINPKKQNFALEPIIEEDIGPGQYEINEKHVKKRTDIGVIKMPEINDFNDRVENMNPVKEGFDPILPLNPNIDATKPNPKGFQYHQPTEHQPAHIPDKELFPEKWEFYDPNMNAVKERTDIGVVQYLDLESFQQHEQWLLGLKHFLDKRREIPHVGQYKPSYKQMDVHVANVDFEKYEERDNDPIVHSEGPVAGDNLILNPQLPQNHVGIIKFEKQSERVDPNEKKLNEFNKELILNPNIEAIKPKVKNLVNIKKQMERPETPKQKEKELALEKNFNHVDKKVKGQVKINLHPEREADPRFQPKVDDRKLKLDVKLDKVKSNNQKTGVRMDKGAVRFKK